MLIMTSVRWRDNVLRWLPGLLRDGFERDEEEDILRKMYVRAKLMWQLLGYIPRCRRQLGRPGYHECVKEDMR